MDCSRGNYAYTTLTNKTIFQIKILRTFLRRSKGFPSKSREAKTLKPNLPRFNPSRASRFTLRKKIIEGDLGMKQDV